MQKQKFVTATKVAMIMISFSFGGCFGMYGDGGQEKFPGGYAATVYQQSGGANQHPVSPHNVQTYGTELQYNSNIPPVGVLPGGLHPVSGYSQTYDDPRILELHNRLTQLEQKIISHVANNVQMQAQLDCCKNQLLNSAEVSQKQAERIAHLEGQADVFKQSKTNSVVFNQSNNTNTKVKTDVDSQNNNDADSHYKSLKNEGIVASILIIASLCKFGLPGAIGTTVLLSGGGCYKHRGFLFDILRKFCVGAGCLAVAAGSMGFAMVTQDKDATAAAFVIVPACLIFGAAYGVAT